MTNHPNRSRSPYTAELFGSSWRTGPTAEFKTVREARAWAESYGSTADSCTIRDAKGSVVGEHRRYPSHDGMRWYRAGTME